MNYDLLLQIKNQLWQGNRPGNQFYEGQSGSSHVSGDDSVVLNRVVLILEYLNLAKICRTLESSLSLMFAEVTAKFETSKGQQKFFREIVHILVPDYTNVNRELTLVNL